uniref:SnoaL-like domain-containing protein n=1 Tax=Chromera velia CCMP2878 TaxID=1169474 RepID=A0A0G4FT86_9ALVE|eukprot:Cvel_18638.t1-p1 / transcript=Cvel_18638.t1 / gene=Cvel_18638 / organism=Chromera_velia_CCMP2878 / gene_product=hypothetical protein / transcript_product=hypothetical protein / location=Cvel_scaffold1557:6393-8415(+) / protein_length=275 / sequence_SO=supercontig / SO=protein_coding / is_pseudo=false
MQLDYRFCNLLLVFLTAWQFDAVESFPLLPFRESSVSRPKKNGQPSHRAQGGWSSLSMGKEQGDGDEKEKKKRFRTEAESVDAPLKAVWFASEAFGDAVGFLKRGGSAAEVGGQGAATGQTAKALPFSQAQERLRKDYDRVYFVTGDMDLDLYEADCLFADPFVSFTGLSRFKKNLDNLGAFMEDVDLKLTDWKTKKEQMEETNAKTKADVVRTKWRFRCTLGLPWRPTLAARGGTDHYFSPDTGRIVRHVEQWDIDPWDALKQLLRPGKQKVQK